MTRPISFRQPAIGAFVAGTLCRVRRPLPGQYSKTKPGDLLWIREPFHLEAKWDGWRPTAAIDAGAPVTFAADLEFEEAAKRGLGAVRAARTLPKAAHRQHAVVRSVDRQRLQLLTREDAQAEGFRDRGAWAADWDRSLMGFGTQHDQRLWRLDPVVVVLALDRVAAPLPAEDR